jgi:hypothetical protein
MFLFYIEFQCKGLIFKIKTILEFEIQIFLIINNQIWYGFDYIRWRPGLYIGLKNTFWILIY